MNSFSNANVPNSDIDYLKSVRSAANKSRFRGANFILFAIAAIVIALGIWANYAEIDEATKGTGKVIPSSSIQTVQNLEGGILAELLVGDGDVVKKGDILVRIDDTMSASVYRENLARRDALEASAARLKAEAASALKIEFTERTLQNRPDLVAQESRLFNQKRDAMAQQLDGFNRSLELVQKELTMTVPLVSSGALPEVEQIRLERQVVDLKNEINLLKTDGPNLALEKLSEVNGDLEALNEALAGREDQVKRTLVQSPVDGTVNKIHFKTIGGVVQPGEPIVDIVPLNDTLLVEALIKPSDIAFLRPGQKATVKITAYDFSMYGGLSGTVEQISADTIYDEIAREHFYQIKVRNNPGEQVTDKSGDVMPIIPGMVAEVDVLTGRRTVMQYLTKPFHRARYNSLRER